MPQDQRELVDHRAHVEKMEYPVQQERQVARDLQAEMALTEKRDHPVMWDLLEHQDSLDPEDPLVQAEVQDPMDQREIQECPDLKDTKVQLVSRAPPEVPEKEDPQGLVAPRENVARQDLSVSKGHRVCQAKGDPQEDVVYLDNLENPDPPESMAKLDHVA